MGSFEKLGILVIVVIIVMILAVAIYQWGAASDEALPPIVQDPTHADEEPAPLIVDFVDPPVLGGERESVEAIEPSGDSWPGGIPRVHTVRPSDTVWDLVVKEWRLQESFIPVVRAANPGLDLERLRPGKSLVVPDPAAYGRDGAGTDGASRAPGTRRYEIQVGDNLESIARNHLGRRSRWREIKQLNPGLDEKRLRPGQAILIPVR